MESPVFVALSMSQPASESGMMWVAPPPPTMRFFMAGGQGAPTEASGNGCREGLGR